MATTPVKMNLSTLARLPLYLMESELHPFDDWKDPSVDVPDNVIQMFNFYTWLYQLYIFYMVTSESLGNDIAVKVVELQNEAEKFILGDNLFDIQKNLDNIHAAVHKLLKNPIIEDIYEVRDEMPIEYGMAKMFLFSGDFSPITYKEEDVDLGYVAILGLCLFHAKQSAIAHFDKVLSDIDLNEDV